MSAEREYLDPARRSSCTSTSLESVIEVFSLLHHLYDLTFFALLIGSLCHSLFLLTKAVFCYTDLLPLRFCLEPAMPLHPDVCAEVVKLADTPS